MKLSVNNGCFSYGVNRFSYGNNRFNYGGTKKSKPETPVLENLNFEVESGDLLAILGPNGAGKTTLLRCIMGFLRWREGVSALDGRDIGQIPSSELWKRIAYVPQARSAASSYTALETVLLGRTARVGVFSRPSEQDERLALEVMERLGVERLRSKPCSEMSGGEFQMVLIAKALAAQPEALILDEPESNLDFKNQLIVLDTVTSLAAGGMLCVFNTHYPAHALSRANKSLMLGRGGSYLFGDTGSVVTEENIAGMFGVKAVIGELETPESSVRTVVPLSVLENPAEYRPRLGEKDESRTIAVVSVISKRDEASAQINALLHQYRDFLVGRMGMPYRAAKVNIINVTLDAPEYVIAALDSKLRKLEGVSVKTTRASDIAWKEP